MIAPKSSGNMVKVRRDKKYSFYSSLSNMEYALVLIPRKLAVNGLSLEYWIKQRSKK